MSATKTLCTRAISDMTPCVLVGVVGAKYAYMADGRCIGCGRSRKRIESDGERAEQPDPSCFEGESA